MKALVSGALLLALCSIAGAAAETPQDGLSHWWGRIQQELDSIAEEKRVVPPVARKVRWRPSRIWSGELAGELVDITAGDLDDDGSSEIYALTTENIVVFSRSRGLFDVRARHDLPGTPARIRSREPIGSITVGQSEGLSTLRARTSEQEQGGTYQLVDNALQLVSEFIGYPLCRNSSIAASPGRNFFLGSSVQWHAGHDAKLGDLLLGGAVLSARCSRDTVDATGHALDLLSEVSVTGNLRVQCRGDEQQCQLQTREYLNVGYAHLVADVDNDGVPEVVTTSTSLPGERDQILVRSQSAQGERVLFDRSFTGGIVAITAGDFEGDDSLGVVIAVRNQERVSLWLLN